MDAWIASMSEFPYSLFAFAVPYVALFFVQGLIVEGINKCQGRRRLPELEGQEDSEDESEEEEDELDFWEAAVLGRMSTFPLNLQSPLPTRMPSVDDRCGPCLTNKLTKCLLDVVTGDALKISWVQLPVIKRFVIHSEDRDGIWNTACLRNINEVMSSRPDLGIALTTWHMFPWFRATTPTWHIRKATIAQSSTLRHLELAACEEEEFESCVSPPVVILSTTRTGTTSQWQLQSLWATRLASHTSPGWLVLRTVLHHDRVFFYAFVHLDDPLGDLPNCDPEVTGEWAATAWKLVRCKYGREVDVTALETSWNNHWCLLRAPY